MNILAPSLLAADFYNLKKDIEEVTTAGADYLHLDVMDGKFVPSISYGMPVIKSIRKESKLPFDVHLMIEDPDRYLDDFKNSGADIITVHAEACVHLDRTLNAIKGLGLKCCVALNPSTSIETIKYVLPICDMVLLMSVNPGFGGQKYISYVTDKIRSLAKIKEDNGYDFDIEVDGGITLQNVKEVLDAGANVIVAGSSVFKGNITENVKAFNNILK